MHRPRLAFAEGAGVLRGRTISEVPELLPIAASDGANDHEMSRLHDRRVELVLRDRLRVVEALHPERAPTRVVAIKLRYGSTTTVQV